MEVKEIEIEKIITRGKGGIGNVRIEKPDVGGMLRSIDQIGLLQPIGVFKEGEQYVVYMGHSRLESFRKLGWKKIPCILSEHKTEEEYLIANLTENTQRKDVLPIEQGRVFEILKNKYSYSVLELSAKFGLPASVIKKDIRLYQITPDVYKNKVLGRKTHSQKPPGLNVTIASGIAHIYLSPEEKNYLYEYAIKEDLTINDLRVIKHLLSTGMNLKDAINTKDRYWTRNVTVFLIKKEYALFKKEKKSLPKLVAKLLNEHNPDLFPNLTQKKQA